MANDPPTNLRMGFGYHQARQSGMGGIRQDRSPNQVNREIDERQIAKQIREVIESDPEWAPFVAHWVKEKVKARDIIQSLSNAQVDAWRRRKGYRTRYAAPF
jgi:hypothetical protein